ncbi:MAG: flagellar biosynthesis anti-sigma factor FlgM [Actinomycetota bacterium]
MIISHDEIVKCMDIIAVETGASPSVGMTPAARVYAEIFKKRLETVEAKQNERLKDVKEAVASSQYRVASDEVAEKMLGRVISDKVR